MSSRGSSTGTGCATPDLGGTVLIVAVAFWLGDVYPFLG